MIVPVITRKKMNGNLYCLTKDMRELCYNPFNNTLKSYRISQQTHSQWLNAITSNWLVLGWIREEDFTIERLPKLFPEVFL